MADANHFSYLFPFPEALWPRWSASTFFWPIILLIPIRMLMTWSLFRLYFRQYKHIWLPILSYIHQLITASSITIIMFCFIYEPEFLNLFIFLCLWYHWFRRTYLYKLHCFEQDILAQSPVKKLQNNCLENRYCLYLIEGKLREQFKTNFRPIS